MHGPLNNYPEVIRRFRQGSRVHDELAVEIWDGDAVWMIGVACGDPGVVAWMKCQDNSPCSHADQEVTAPETSFHQSSPAACET
jgi:hypothetical protein